MRVPLLLLLVGSACGGGSTQQEALEPQDQPVRKQAGKRAKDVILEAYSSVRRGDVDGMQALAVEDVFVVGPGAGEVFVTRTDTVVALAALGHGEKHEVRSHDLQVTASPAAKSAWAVDQVDIDGTTYHLSAILVEADDIWQIVAVHLGEATGGSGKKAPKPGALAGTVGAGAEPLVERFKKDAGDLEKLLEQMPGRKDVVVAGTSEKEYVRGAKNIKKALKKKLKRNPKMAPHEIRAALTPDGTLGWIVANVDYEDDKTDRVRQRLTLVYEKSPRDWRLLAIHSSLGSR